MKMKRILILLLCASMLLLSACTKKGNDPEDTSDTTATELTLFGGGEDYKLVYSATAGDYLKKVVVDFRGEIQDLIGKKPEVITDDTAKNPESAKEIVIGKTNRRETTETESARGYRVEFVGEKLYVTGSNDYLISAALDELLTAVTTADGKVTAMSNLVLEHDGNGLVNLMSNEKGVFNYTVILPNKASEELSVSANNFRDSLRDLVGIRPQQKYDTEKDASETEIVIGETNREESGKAYAELEYFDYIVRFEGKRLVVAAKSDTQIENALGALLSEMRIMADSNYNGEFLMRSNLSLSDLLFPWAGTIPMIKAGSFGGIYDAGDNTFVIVQNESKKTDYDTYLAELKAAGFAEKQTWTLGDNKENTYTLLSSKMASLYVSHLGLTNTVRVYAEQAGNSTYPTVSEPTEGGRETPTMWQLKSDYLGSGHTGGSSFVFRLSDGSYIVEDGGYETDAEADQLYRTLMKYTPAGEKPVVRLWIITHLHSDHYGCLRNFSQRYADKIEVEAFGYNYTKNERNAGSMGGLISSVDKAMKSWPDAVHYNKLHSGMSLGFADAKVTVICSQEDIYPTWAHDFNDTSLTVRVDIGGQRVMLLADSCSSESRTMSETIPVSELKSDMVQIAHHGFEGCLKDLYQKIDARVGLWTMAIYAWKMDTVAEVFKNWMTKTPGGNFAYPNYWLITESSIEQFLVDGAGTVELQLPYTDLTKNNVGGYDKYYSSGNEVAGSGHKFPDYVGIAQAEREANPRTDGK